MADIELLIKIPEGLKKDFELEQWTALSCMEMKDALMKGTLLPKRYGKLTNHDWIDFLVEQFSISKTSAKEMLHVMMSVKREDNFKKQFSGRK